MKVEQVEDVEEMQPIHKVEIVDYEMPEVEVTRLIVCHVTCGCL